MIGNASLLASAHIILILADTDPIRGVVHISKRVYTYGIPSSHEIAPLDCQEKIPLGPTPEGFSFGTHLTDLAKIRVLGPSSSPYDARIRSDLGNMLHDESCMPRSQGPLPERRFQYPRSEATRAEARQETRLELSASISFPTK